MTTHKAILLMPLIALAGCDAGPPPTLTNNAQAVLRNAQGETVGTATFTGTDSGVEMTLKVSGLEPGQRGFHIHAVGSCEPPDFESAGDHFNPTGAPHGFEASGGPHLGDLHNLEVDQNGVAEAQRTIEGATLGADEDRSLFGKALVIHADADDYRSQPSGNAGARVACGVIELVAPSPLVN
jgi:superoxide dismutase, Cu-Zn family